MNYLVIPEITEYEELVSVSAEDDGRTTRIVINASNTATQLLAVVTRGQVLPLVVVATDGMTYAMDNVVVSEATIGSSEGTPLMYATLQAEAVRVV